jgi:PII-like signaling protein
MTEPQSPEVAISTGRGRRLTVFFGENDHYHHQPLYMAIVERLRREGYAGATVTRGIAGFGGASHMIHTSTILRLSMDMPIVLTIVDGPARMGGIMRMLAEMAPHALIVAEDVEILQAGNPRPDSPARKV